MSEICISEIIEMAWCDKTAFDDIEKLTGLAEKEVIMIMRDHMKPSSFRMWRKRVSGRSEKHKHRNESLIQDAHIKTLFGMEE